MPGSRLFFIPLLFFTLPFSLTALAQDVPDVTDVSRAQLLTPGFGYEKRLGRFQTLHTKAYMAAGFGWSYSSSAGSNAYLSVAPAAVVGYRYYYNAKKRAGKEKRTAMNSLNYLSLLSDFVFTRARVSGDDAREPGRRLLNTTGIAWGIQRNYAGRLSLDLNVGLGYFQGRVHETDLNGIVHPRTQRQFNTLGELTIGIWLNKRS